MGKYSDEPGGHLSKGRRVIRWVCLVIAIVLLGSLIIPAIFSGL